MEQKKKKNKLFFFIKIKIKITNLLNKKCCQLLLKNVPNLQNAIKGRFQALITQREDTTTPSRQEVVT
jgi:hypothetical protein